MLKADRSRRIMLRSAKAIIVREACDEDDDAKDDGSKDIANATRQG